MLNEPVEKRAETNSKDVNISVGFRFIISQIGGNCVTSRKLRKTFKDSRRNSDTRKLLMDLF